MVIFVMYVEWFSLVLMEQMRGNVSLWIHTTKQRSLPDGFELNLLYVLRIYELISLYETTEINLSRVKSILYIK